MSDTSTSVVSQAGGRWFSELSSMWPGRCLSLEMDEVLHQERSKFQELLVFKSKSVGTVLCLDGVVQCTDSDEFSYQEMITHLPLFAHPDPKTVLVIGGGDGGAVREICRHSCVERIDHCEIDEAVIRTCRKYFPKMTSSLDDPRVTIHIGDGLAFVKEKKNEYDVIIVDSSDPVGPAESLFGPDFYRSVAEALKPEGIVCSQAENVWLHLDLIGEIMTSIRPIFRSVEYAFVSTPTYPGGQIGFLISSNSGRSAATPVRHPTPEMQEQLRYYEPRVHSAAFVLPRFASSRLHGST